MLQNLRLHLKNNFRSKYAGWSAKKIFQPIVFRNVISHTFDPENKQ